MGYTLFVLITMLILPVAALLLERRRGRKPLPELIGKWFIFFGVGVRLLVTGLTQMLNPGFTGELLQLDRDTLLVVRELGFTNVLLAAVALASLWRPGLRVLGTAGALYMGFAGLLHAANQTPASTARETVALWSDLWICAVAVVYLAYRFTTSLRSRSASLS